MQLSKKFSKQRKHYTPPSLLSKNPERVYVGKLHTVYFKNTDLYLPVLKLLMMKEIALDDRTCHVWSIFHWKYSNFMDYVGKTELVII